MYFRVRHGIFGQTGRQSVRRSSATQSSLRRTEWEIRCAFNSFCKKAIKCEASNAHRDVRRHQLREVTLSSLSPQEESQLYTVDRYFVKEYADNSICVAGKRITPKLLAEALRTLPEEKRFNGFLAKAIKSAADFPFGTIRLIHVLTSFRSRESG